MFEKSWYLFVLRIQARLTLEPLIQALEVQTAIAGSLYGVNAFDRPGVGAGKQTTCKRMGRPGY